MDTGVPVDGDTARAWVAVAQSARMAQRILRAVGAPAPRSNFSQIDSTYPFEKASDWHRAFLSAALEHLILWADLAAPLKFHPEQDVTHSFRPAYTLGRAALEASSQAVWMSAGATAEECTRRHLSLSRWDYEEHRKSVRDPADKARVSEMDAKLLSRVAHTFSEEDLARPSHYTVLRAMAPVIGRHSDDVERIWRAASGSAHGRIWPSLALQHLVPIAEHEPGQVRAVTVPDPAGMTEVLEAANEVTMYGVLRHADYCNADIPALMDEARLWLVSVVPFRDDADPAVVTYLSRGSETEGSGESG